LFPIDIDREIELPFLEKTTAAVALATLKDILPYTFRFETAESRGRKPHPELTDTQVSLSAGIKTTREIIKSIVAQLPSGWQATALPSRIILYKEDRHYNHGAIIARS